MIRPREKGWSWLLQWESQVLLSHTVFVKCIKIEQNSIYVVKNKNLKCMNLNEVESIQNRCLVFVYLFSLEVVYSAERVIMQPGWSVKAYTIAHKFSDKLGHLALVVRVNFQNELSDSRNPGNLSQSDVKFQKCVKFQGNLKGESVVVAILSTRMEVSYCTSRFFHS